MLYTINWLFSVIVYTKYLEARVIRSYNARHNGISLKVNVGRGNKDEMTVRRRIATIPPAALRQARERFARLLSAATSERDWQKFFSEAPFVFSTTLPVALAPHDIVPRGRPGRSEADFIFCATDSVIPVYGIIELKRPDTKILTLPRQNVLRLSGDAHTALAQAELYSSELGRELLCHPSRALVVGSHAHAFIILGLSDELAEVVGDDILKAQFDRLLPAGIQLIPYDMLFHAFSATVPPAIFMLVPRSQNPPASVRLDRGLVVVDYAGSGTSAVPDVTELDSLKGVTVGKWPSLYLSLTKQGCCPFCGELRSARSLGKPRHTPAGVIQDFFSGTTGPVAYRDLECTTKAHAGPRRYREEYDIVQAKTWFSDLKAGVCRRCGSEDVGYSESNPMDNNRIAKWWCRDCGFYEERHSWGRESDGA